MFPFFLLTEGVFIKIQRNDERHFFSRKLNNQKAGDCRLRKYTSAWKSSSRLLQERLYMRIIGEGKMRMILVQGPAEVMHTDLHSLDIKGSYTSSKTSIW